MRARNSAVWAVVLTCSLGAILVAGPDGGRGGAKAAERPKVQLAILLDTSGSMGGLINQARSELWKIVNEFIGAEARGQRPELYVALYQYGSSSLPRADGYMRKLVGLSDDLDKVSQELFALTIGGSKEYCGQVIDRAVRDLEWSASSDDLKLIFIAGNEPFTQGSVDYRTACKTAISKGIVVNTIHCGDQAAGIGGKWRDAALLADGNYLNIDQNKAVVDVPAPQDKEIVKLNAELNKTYMAYGKHGAQGLASQKDQDRNASSVSASSIAQRAQSKASAYYRNASWDLADAIKDGKVKLEDLKDEELPVEMRKMTQRERAAHVVANARKRGDIQKSLQKLGDERKAHVAADMKERAARGEQALDEAMLESIRQQAAKKEFKLR